MREVPVERNIATFVLASAKAMVVLSGIATIGGAAGNFYWLLELLSHFMAWYAAASAVSCGVLLGCRRWRWAAGGIALAVLQAAFPLAWYLPSGQEGAGGDGETIRLLLANVYSQNQDTGRLLELVEQVDPEVVCVQEVSPLWETALQSLESAYSSHRIIPRADNFGIALYSRLPAAALKEPFPELNVVPAIECRITLPASGEMVSLLTIHSVPPVGRRLAGIRAKQFAAIGAWTAEQSGEAIVVGDLNVTMFSPAYRRLIRHAGLRNAREGAGPLGTWPAWVPWMRLPIDHCLVSAGIEVVSCAVGPNIGSDHLPLLVEVRVGSKAL